MFREYVELIDESVNEGANRGVHLFLENLNQDMIIDELFEELGGADATIKQIFVENGFETTELELMESASTMTESEDEAFDKKLDNILEQLKKEGVVD